eukprot:TRINITY_DN853_c0_g2_i1.p1 TRINITY_DN853_c0_g2~~TRINITY_DN853_c0_g2_i1.p1  ORF type:complete len:490 (+),score=114.46 TRINITY_DN853_c0_g2_i1:95-1564(+)
MGVSSVLLFSLSLGILLPDLPHSILTPYSTQIVIASIILFATQFAYIYFFGRSIKSGKNRANSQRVVVTLSDDKIKKIVDEWNPAPLAPPLSLSQQRNFKEVVIQSSTRTHVTVEGKGELINLARSSYLGMIGHPKLQEAAEQALRKYGCGSCGPRGFYGTVDVHMYLENKINQFLGGDETILYSSGFAAVSSTISCFSKVNDILIVDEGVSHAIQIGVTLSRSRVYYFKHNDIEDLERILAETMPKKGDKLVRKFVVVEGLYYNYGDVCPLPQIMALKDKYLFRLILDESHSIGVLGKHGKGVTEHFGIDIKQIELLTGCLSNAFGSVGGFCVADKTLVYYMRLNGSGYVFSASLPPYLSVCSLSAFDILEEDRTLLPSLFKNLSLLYDGLSAIKGLKVTSMKLSPVIHLRVDKSQGREKDEELLERIVEEALNNGVLLTRAKYVDNEKFLPTPSIRVCVSAVLSEKDIQFALKAVRNSAEKVLRSCA